MLYVYYAIVSRTISVVVVVGYQHNIQMNELGILLTLFWFTCIGAVSCADEDPKPQE